MFVLVEIPRRTKRQREGEEEVRRRRMVVVNGERGMRNKKHKWTSEEEDALKAAVAKYGTGRWKSIQNDPKFNQRLPSRSNIDLKDKWRNMIVRAENQEKKEKSLTTPGDPSVAGDLVADDSSKNVKNVSKNAAMILEAVSALNEPNGSNSGAIIAYLKERQDLPPSFGKILSSRLRKLVTQEKLEKVENGYKIKKGSFSTDGPVPKPEDGRPTQNPDLTSACETVEEATETTKNDFSLTKAPISKPKDGLTTQNADLISACETVEESAETIKEGSSSTKAPIPKPKEDRPTQNADLISACETVEEAAEIITKGSSSTKAPSPKREEVRATQNLPSACHTVEEEAFSLARTIAEAEYRSLVAAIAVREWERVAKMAEDEDSLSQLADEIFEECISGEVQVWPKQSERTADTTEESDE